MTTRSPVSMTLPIRAEWARTPTTRYPGWIIGFVYDPTFGTGYAVMILDREIHPMTIRLAETVIK